MYCEFSFCHNFKPPKFGFNRALCIVNNNLVYNNQANDFGF